MGNFTSDSEEDKYNLRKLKNIAFLANGFFSLALSATIFVANIVLIVATARNPRRLNKVINKIHNSLFYINLFAVVFFLPYFGIAEILRGLQITEKTFPFPSYLSVTHTFFAQSNVNVALLVTVERSSAFIFPHFHRRIMTKAKVLITLLLTQSFALVFACFQFTGIKEIVFYTVYIHLFISAPMLVIFFLVCVTYWNIKNRNRVVSGETPQSTEQLELRRKRTTRSARKYLTVVSLFMVPMSLCISPWCAVKVIEITFKKSLTTDVGFFLQRFSISLLFLPGVFGPITLALRFEEYSTSLKLFFRRI